ncbi:MAG: fibro-slime domain-containing protein [Fibrobacter sp.]|nr:fibro-slime domain-containing protein [Fibrobacter sp.]
MKPFKTFIAAIAALGISYTWAETVKEFHVFLPKNMTWKSSVPMINEDGKSRELTIDPDHCGWYYRRYVDEAIPKKVFIYRDDDAEMYEAIGMNGAWEEDDAKPIVLSDLFELYNADANFKNAIYFVADANEAATLPSDNMGWFTVRPEITGNCSFNLATIIYDTDASLHGAFSCAPEWVAGQTLEESHYNDCYSASAKFPVATSATAEMPCIGMTQGMVESTLDAKSRRMKLTAKGKQCFGAQADSAFAAMFNYTKGVNEESCFDMPFAQTANGSFEFNSDYYTSPGTTVPGGFYPAEAPDDIMMISEKLPAARTKRAADAPLFFCADSTPNSKTPLGLRTIDEKEGVAKSNLICNGPGWTGGIDCEGLFARGSEFILGESATATAISKALNVSWNGDGWGWSCPNDAPKGWTTFDPAKEKRNRHFCTETHANFRFRKGLKFNISGNDDIWVFIDNKLAIDIGGTHLAAPGHIDMDKFMPNAETGKYYDIDIFTCNRRATSSDLRINANFAFFAEETSGISVSSKFDTEDYIKNGNNHMRICYKSAGGSCSYALSGGISENCETATIETTIKDKIKYIFTTDKTGNDSTKIIISEAEFAKNPIQYKGGIDITDRAKPIVNENILKESLTGGRYYLIVKIGKYSHAIEINIKSSLAVANREAVSVDENGKRSAPSKFKSMATVSTPLADGSPDINQMVPLYIAAIIDPCSGSNCTDPLEMQQAPGTAYSLQVSNNKAVFYEKKNGKLVAFNPTSSRTIGASGIDTLYVTIPSDEMDSQEEKVSINVKGSARKAEINFFVPKLVFVDSYTTYNVVTKDKDTEPRIKGGIYAFNVIALNADNTPCTDCNFPLAIGSKTSSGLKILSDALVRFGRAVFEVSSSKVYKKGTEASCNGPATLQVVGPNPALMQVSYSNLQFEEPPMSIPQLEAVKKSTFSVQANAPQEISITTSNFTKNGTKTFAVMDMKGQVISTGSLNSSSIRVKVPVSGSYIVKVGTNSKRVNVR